MPRRNKPARRWKKAPSGYSAPKIEGVDFDQFLAPSPATLQLSQRTIDEVRRVTGCDDASLAVDMARGASLSRAVIVVSVNEATGEIKIEPIPGEQFDEDAMRAALDRIDALPAMQEAAARPAPLSWAEQVNESILATPAKDRPILRNRR